jgi:hypothetical protein
MSFKGFLIGIRCCSHERDANKEFWNRECWSLILGRVLFFERAEYSYLTKRKTKITITATALVSHSLFLQTLPRKDDHKSHVYFRESLQDALALANGELSGLGTLALVFVIRNVPGNLSLP